MSIAGSLAKRPTAKIGFPCDVRTFRRIARRVDWNDRPRDKIRIFNGMTITSELIVIVGMNNEADDLAADQQPAFGGFENTLYAEAIVAEQVGTGLRGPIPVHPGRIPGVIAQRLSDSATLMQGFKSRLSDFCLADEALGAYAWAFCDKDKFVVVETHAGRADRTAEILRDSRASGSEST
jgi:hypothetical protein